MTGRAPGRRRHLPQDRGTRLARAPGRLTTSRRRSSGIAPPARRGSHRRDRRALDLQPHRALPVRGRHPGRRAARAARHARRVRGGAAEPSCARPLQRRGRRRHAHLFRVASSLDSMVVGEAQILAQLKEAYQFAGEAGRTSGVFARCSSTPSTWPSACAPRRPSARGRPASARSRWSWRSRCSASSRARRCWSSARARQRAHATHSTRPASSGRA